MSTGRTIRFILTAAFMTAGVISAATTTAKAPERHPVRKEYVKKTFGKQAIPRVVAGAALGRGKGGFGRHLATSFEGHVVNNTVEYAVAGVRHEDLHYHRSDQKGFGHRLRHALVSTFVTRKTTTGRKTVATGRLSGAAVAGVVAGGAATGGITIGANAGANVAREFWPRKRRAAGKRPS